MFSFFGSSSPFDADVDKATSENNISEQWDLIMDICDKVGSSTKNAKDCLRSIMRRMSHHDPHVAIQAITLLDACIKNCGIKFHLEIASREFETEFQRLMSKSPPPIALKMRVSLKKWSENEFKSDSQLNLIPSLYERLRSEGLDFNDTSAPKPKSQMPLSKDPNVVSSQQEEDDIAKAIELSLKEKGDGPKLQSNNNYPTLYPPMSAGNNGGSNGGNSVGNNQTKTTPKHTAKKEARKVRALYDFEAAEDNELTFSSGEIIHVLDDSDANWWTGFNDRGEGLFPSNFVTADLNAEVESNVPHFEAASPVVVADVEKQVDVVDIDEAKIDRLCYLLHEANPEDPSQDTEEMLILESQVNQMLPLIDNELERIDRHHAKLTQLSSNLVDAINMYHMLMRESDIRLTTNYQMNSGQMYRPGQHPPNETYNPNMYAMPPNYRMPGQFPGAQYHGQPDSLPSGPQSIDSAAMLPPAASAQHGPQSLQQPPFYPNRYSFTPVEAQMGPQSYPGNGPEQQQQQQPQQPQYAQPSTAVPHPQQFSPQVLNAPAPSMNYVNNGEVVGAGAGLPYGHMPPYFAQQPNPSDTTVSMPNTVMTTQVQHSVSMPPSYMNHQNAPLQQQPHVLQNINQPVSTTILQNDSRANIPVMQQQR